MFAWDFADEGIDTVLAWAADSGLDALQVATSYHAGWFVHPHNPNHRVYMPEDGCVYFHPDVSLYRGTKLQPKVASVCAGTDWVREAGKRLDTFGLGLVSWTVCAHNTRLGMLHPDCTVTNVYGDSYPHALCPANEHVRQYFVALCRDLATNLPMRAIQLESPGYMGMKHGHHHERDLTVLTPTECALIDLCFCSACVGRAEGQGIDVGAIRATVRAILDAGMAAAPERPADHPRTLAEVEESCPELTAFLAFRAEVENSLLDEIKAAIAPTGAELWHFGGPSERIAETVDVYHGSVYGQKADAVLAATRDLKARIEPRHRLHMGVRLGLNSVRDADELTDILTAIRDGGADGVMLYNYSESPRRTLDWIKPALAETRKA